MLTACPLDCPDSCTLSVTVRDGRVIDIDGGHDNPVTHGYICAKVRRFADRMYGDARLRYPMVRTGPKEHPTFARVEWDEALELIASRMAAVRTEWGAEAILPFCYGGSNGMLTHDGLDALFFRRLGASRLARTVCAAPTGAANLALYGKMPSVTYQDYPHARLIVLWGMNPSVSGIHAIPYLREARDNGARIVVVDPRTTPVARTADLHLAGATGHGRRGGARDSSLPLRGGLCGHGVPRRSRARSGRTPRARRRVDVRARGRRIGHRRRQRSRNWRGGTRRHLPRLIRCGWGLERNRNGGNAALAVLALPAVGGKFGVRGGGYAMSNSASWGITRPWVTEPEPDTRLVNMNHLGRVLTEPVDPPVKMLFVYNCNPAVTIPDQQRVLKGLQREDLFTVVFEQVFTDSCLYADVVLPATTFLEGYDVARAYGPLSMQLGRPVVDPIGEARSNADVFGELSDRMGLLRDGEPRGELDLLVRVLGDLPPGIGARFQEGRPAEEPWNGVPVQFVDVFPQTSDGKVHLFPEALEREAPLGLYRYQPDPATLTYPLALISPASDRTVSSTLGELPRPAVKLLMHPADAASRGLDDGDDVRVFNELGEVRCGLQLGAWVRPGVVSLPKGLWRKSTANSNTATTLAPDTLTDIAGGACFNDARVQVAKV